MAISFGLTSSVRTRPLLDGRVEVAGVESDFTVMQVQDLFNLQAAQHVFDVCEFPLVTYLRNLELDEQPYLAIPVFPSRHFRLSCIFVGENSDISTPSDLAGRTIGVSVFDMAAAVWLRGILHDHFGLDRHSPTYVIGGLEIPREGDEHPQFYPEGFDFERRSDTSLALLLAEGKIDAIVTARAPSTWPTAGVRRLFEDPRPVELDYYHKSGIFPAMHVIAMKRELAIEQPDLPKSLFDAFSLAQQLGRADTFDSAALDTLLPWQLEELLRTEELLGVDYWPVGLSANQTMLNKIVEYSFADGLITTRFEPADLFAGPGQEDILTT